MLIRTVNFEASELTLFLFSCSPSASKNNSLNSHTGERRTTLEIFQASFPKQRHYLKTVLYRPVYSISVELNPMIKSFSSAALEDYIKLSEAI